MFSITCHRCGHRELTTTRSILSLHNTSEGPVAYVRCSKGHPTLTWFRTQITVNVDDDDLVLAG